MDVKNTSLSGINFTHSMSSSDDFDSNDFDEESEVSNTGASS